jgi:hypothetical protein
MLSSPRRCLLYVNKLIVQRHILQVDTTVIKRRYDANIVPMLAPVSNVK